MSHYCYYTHWYDPYYHCIFRSPTRSILTSRACADYPAGNAVDRQLTALVRNLATEESLVSYKLNLLL